MGQDGYRNRWGRERFFGVVAGYEAQGQNTKPAQSWSSRHAPVGLALRDIDGGPVFATERHVYGPAVLKPSALETRRIGAHDTLVWPATNLVSSPERSAATSADSILSEERWPQFAAQVVQECWSSGSSSRVRVWTDVGDRKLHLLPSLILLTSSAAGACAPGDADEVVETDGSTATVGTGGASGPGTSDRASADGDDGPDDDSDSDGTSDGASDGDVDSDSDDGTSGGEVGDALVSEDFTVSELRLLQRRAGGDTAFNFVTLGDVSPNSPGDWERIRASAGAFEASMADFVEMPLVDDFGDWVTPDFYNFWNGPIAGERTPPGGGPYWDGTGLIPTWAPATKKSTGNGFVRCDANDNYWTCQDAFEYGDDLLSAALVAAVEEDEALMDAVRRVLLRQTDVSRAPGVDFSNRERWGLGDQGQGFGDGQQVSSTNPFFFTSLWVVKIAKAYDYTRHRVVDGRVVDNPVYTAEDRAQIENWLFEAAEYFREVIEQLLLEEVRVFDSVDARIAGTPTANIDQPPYSDFSLWDGGPIATYGQLLYQNRITDTAMSVCVVGWILERDPLIRDCKLFFEEVIRYNVRPDGSLGDYYRGGNNGETGQHYVTGQLGHLVEIADLFARHGDPSLYEYSTSEGSNHPNFPESSTVGGPKSLLDALLISARKNRPQGYEGRHKEGQLIDGDTGGSGRRYLQHYLTWARGNAYYRNAELEGLLDGDPDLGFRPLQPPSQVFNNGYVVDTTRGTFAASPGELFLHGKKADCEVDKFPYPGVTAPPCL